MAPAIGRHHAEWLSLVETSGPFLSIPVLSKALPQGLDAPDRDVTARLRSAREQLDDDPTLHRSWCEFVLHEVLDLNDTLATGAQIPTGQEHRAAEHSDTVRPDLVVVDHGEGAPKPVMHVTIHNPTQRLERRISDAAWSASPIDRVAALCRATGVSLGLATNGQSWALVFARPGETTGVCTWDADLWLEEPVTLRAFRTLLGAHRFFSVAADDTLPALLEQSAKNQQEVTDRLGAQVRQAVELLIDALDRADHDRKGELLGAIPNEELYRAAVTMMMRLVFLFVAEERRLLPIEDPLYAESYAASTLREQLEERAVKFGEDPLERSSAAWYRLLAVSRAVHGGIEHEGLRLPAYGGGLFDPDRYPFLEGRSDGTQWRHDVAEPLPVDDRTVLHLLTALQVLAEPGRAGQPPTSVRLSFRALDVEQIGHVYEGLLDHTAVRSFDAALGLVGKPEAEISLTLLEKAAAQGEDTLIELLKEHTAKTPAAIRKALAAPTGADRAARALAACDNDPHLRDRVLPFLELVRDELRGNPRVFLAGALYVTVAGDRRTSGTYYTPRALAEEVAQHALDPVAYSPGPAEEPDPAKWKLKSANELLNLKVADLTMGSGAFLVASSRYLAARLLQAWEAEAVPVGSAPRDLVALHPTGPLPADPLEREVLAHRLVAERCLYGVDRNPMAVEMAKLSLWLVTLAKDRPFSFLDHSLREGDSLLGVTSLDQVRSLHVDPARGRALHENLLGYTRAVEPAVDRAFALRDELESFVVGDVRDAWRKAELHARATATLGDVRLIADVVIGAAFANGDGDELDAALASIEAYIPQLLDDKSSAELRTDARRALAAASQSWLQAGQVDGGVNRRCFHWALELPEVTRRGGFDAIVGNPPFQGGSKVSVSLGTSYRTYLTQWIAFAKTNRADLVGFFMLRAAALLRSSGSIGILSTKTIAQGASLEFIMRPLIEARGLDVVRAVPSLPWPGSAAVLFAKIWMFQGSWRGDRVLSGREVKGITPNLLEAGDAAARSPEVLKEVYAAVGAMSAGIGFIITHDEARHLVALDPRNVEVLYPYLSGKDLTTSPQLAASRSAIYFRDWPLERAEEFSAVLALVKERVKPKRDQLPDSKRKFRDHWWLYEHHATLLVSELESQGKYLLLPRVSKYFTAVLLSGRFLPNTKVVCFPDSSPELFGLLTSNFHVEWALAWAGDSKLGPVYDPSRCALTLAKPPADIRIGSVQELDQHRREVMLERGLGLTSLYNLVHDPRESSPDVGAVRDLHIALDYDVRDAYGWTDLDLAHGFYSTSQGVRYTFEPSIRQEILDRLVELNLERHAAEDVGGRHAKRQVSPGSTLSIRPHQTSMFQQ